jgi:hypothetical protein
MFPEKAGGFAHFFQRNQMEADRLFEFSFGIGKTSPERCRTQFVAQRHPSMTFAVKPAGQYDVTTRPLPCHGSPP